tara:strand:- start:227 stop:568 length:342 start_codon:yes stop_codon:yes gene_type:complete
MGAHCQQDFAIGRFKTAGEAYNKLVEEAERRHGDDGYNGTISTSDGIKMITEHPRYGTKKFWKFVDDTMDGTKFSRWNCIEFKGAALKRAKEESGYKGKKNIKAFFFWGLAAS